MLLIDPSVEFLPSASVWTSWQQREETEVCWVWAPARLTRVGLIWLFCCLFLGRWAGEVRGLILTSVRLSEHISQNVQKRFKDKNQDFFLLQLNLKKKKRELFVSTCIARPLIYVDVSLHSNKKEKSWAACVSVECCSRPPAASHGQRGRCCFVRLHPARRRVALKHLQLAALVCRPRCSLATQTLHIITCRDRKGWWGWKGSRGPEHNHSAAHSVTTRCEGTGAARRCEAVVTNTKRRKHHNLIYTISLTQPGLKEVVLHL